jgi:dipeptidyl-peptidase-3
MDLKCPTDFPIGAIDPTVLEKLPKTAVLYASYLSLAAWAGATITMAQVSPCTTAIHIFLSRLLSLPEPDLRDTAAETLSGDDLKHLFEYAATFYSQSGEYSGFGDRKFVPRVSRDSLRVLAEELDSDPDLPLTPGYAGPVLPAFEACADAMYSENDGDRVLGLPDAATTAYFTGMTNRECEMVDEALKGILDPENTTVRKVADAASLCGHRYVVDVAAIEPREVELGTAPDGAPIFAVYGRFAAELRNVREWVQRAIPYAANQDQTRMLEALVRHLTSGDVANHQEYSKHWILDAGPVIETHLGFIETYRDPLGARAEFEAFVAVVDPESSALYGKLVDAAPSVLAQLPWPREFERASFQKPDYTGLEIVAFSTSGLPIGINLPNYSSLRSEHGFKNVSLQNIMRLREEAADKPPSFIHADDVALYKRHAGATLEESVALHELYGHGSGTLLKAEALSNCLDPVTGRRVAGGYGPRDSFDAAFGSLASAFEESRAESVSLFLSANDSINDLFGVAADPAVRKERLAVHWLSMLRSGLVGLEHYDPASHAWTQAHCRARFAILRAVLRDAPEAVWIEGWNTDAPTIRVNPDLLLSHAQPVLANYLRMLTVTKATRDIARGTEYFSQLTAVDARYLVLRDAAIRLRQPRMCFAMPTISAARAGEEWQMEFSRVPATPEGLARSAVRNIAAASQANV